MTADILFALGPIPILEAPAPAAHRVRLVTELLRCTARTAQGQVDELYLERFPLKAISRQLIANAYVGKTSPTSAELPLVLGAISAEAEPSVIGALRRASAPLALAFQTLNDLVSVERLTSAPEGSTFDPRSMALLLRLAWESGKADRRRTLEKAFAEPGFPTAEVLAHLQDSGAIDIARASVVSLFATATEHLYEIGDEPLRDRLAELFQWLALVYEPGSVYWDGLGGYA
jgi:geranylgeranyl pyrophosphate synthase